MEVLPSTADFRVWRRGLVGEVGFVPTMGALHAGHIRLMEASAKRNTATVVSIFVNPLQFGPKEDFSRYPRPLEKDLEACRNAGVTTVFAPSPTSFYAPDHRAYCEVEGLDRHLCGAARPGHFRGVCTVVMKLFQIVKPARAYFGKKDIQQALILSKMVRDFDVDLEMVLVDTVREPSGLAMSSRNAFLSENERERAAAIFQGLTRARETFDRGERSAAVLKETARREIEKSGPTAIQYVEIVSQSLLEPVESVENPAVLAVAVYYGNTRLIDNLLLP